MEAETWQCGEGQGVRVGRADPWILVISIYTRSRVGRAALGAASRSVGLTWSTDCPYRRVKAWGAGGSHTCLPSNTPAECPT